jgi:membrane fusion protein (multidrug efflux system)
MDRKLIISFIAAATLVGCNVKETENNQPKEVLPEPVKTVYATTREYNPTLELTGTFFANQEANLGTALPGRVEKLYFPKGAYVEKGALLAELSDEMLTQALIELSAIKTDFGRVERLREKGSVTIQDYEHLKAKLDATEEKVNMLKKNTEIRAPFSGVIADYLVNEGENYLFSPNLKAGYSMTSGIVRLMQINKLTLRIDVNEKDLPKITKGLKVQISTDVYPGEVFDGVVNLTEPSLNVMSRTATTEIAVDNSKQLIKPGMFGQAKILLAPAEATFVPLDAIVRQPGTGIDYVFYVEGGKAHQKQITIKGYDGTGAIADSIPSSLQLITSGKNRVQEGTSVKITE